MSSETPTPLPGSVEKDLTSVGGDRGTFACRLFFDHIGRADHLDVDLPNVDTVINAMMNEAERFRGQRVRVTLDNGNSVEAELAVAGGFHGDLLNQITGTFQISHATIRTSETPPDRWAILFVNAHVDSYDFGVRMTTPRGWTFNRNEIRFRLANRDWTFVDHASAAWRSQEKPDRSKPVAGVRIETAHIEGDSFDSIEALATDVEALLRLALGRPVSWYAVCKIANGAVTERRDAPRWTATFGSNSQVISNITGGTLAAFLETSYPAYAADRDWLIHTITLFVVSIGASHLEIRMALQNTLLDRISSRVLRHDQTFEIDPAIPERLTKEFRGRLHSRLPPYAIEPQTKTSLHRLVEIAAYLHWCGRKEPDPGELAHWLAAESAVSTVAPLREAAKKAPTGGGS